MSTGPGHVTAIGFLWRLLLSALVTAIITIALAGALSGASKSLANRVDVNTQKILTIISANSALRSASIDALYCIIASNNFTQAGVDECLELNNVPRTYVVP